MIDQKAFISAVADVIGRELNAPQFSCVKHPSEQPLMIVAGPGSGKTTVLVLRALRHVLVDGFVPESVIITTFTKKAAAELTSRLIDWGLRLVEHFQKIAIAAGDMATAKWLEGLDITSVQTGTLDSFCQQWLGSTRKVGSPSPVMLEQFAADFVYRRRVFAPVYRETGPNALLAPFLGTFSFDGRPPTSQSDAGQLSIQVNNRLVQDLVDLKAFSAAKPVHKIQAKLLMDYRAHLQSRQMFDFSLAAERILDGLKDGTLYPEIDAIAALLVDEYQDTNPLQEAIYFELARQSKSSLTIVGDDDQALYRFRGATVELFTNFEVRLTSAFPGLVPKREYLLTNHRSTPPIVDFFNLLSTHDPMFTPARVAGKPAIEPYNPPNGIPVLGMFRENLEDLSADLSQLLVDVFHGAGKKIPGTDSILRGSQKGGALGDAVLLASTAREFKPGQGGDLVDCLPAKLRQKLADQGHGVFNPRGQDLRDLRNVGILLGLVLLCIDASDLIEIDQPISGETRNYLPRWRDLARAYIQTNPPPNAVGGSLGKYVDGWRKRKASNGNWPLEIPLLDLLYKLIVWMPPFQHDPEHQIYLEAIMRCVVQGAHYSSYGFAILDTGEHANRSRMAVVRDLLSPIADKVVDVDEDLLYAVPRSRLSIMTIHQSKGLEYPLVIVDVGSEFSRNHAMQAFKRFPAKPSSTVLMESAFAPYTPVGPFRVARNDMDRTFDDLMRLYYVAFSRAQGALLLVGLSKNIEFGSGIKNLAMFWARNGSWPWRDNTPPLPKGKPTRPQVPFVLL